jgi:glutamate synthase (NADPH/NADH)
MYSANMSMKQWDSDWRPQRQGLYDPKNEKDGCGVGFTADLTGKPTRQTVEYALQIIEGLDHRGASGCEQNTGDGAGILCSMPDKFLRRVAKENGIELPAEREYAVGNVFLAKDEHLIVQGKKVLEDVAKTMKDIRVLGWRTVPVCSDCLGKTAKDAEPCIQQVFLAADGDSRDNLKKFEAALYLLRKKTSHRAILSAGVSFYICSLSCRVINYKGMLTCPGLGKYFPDLQENDFEAHVALVHSRFSTNTFPAWRLSHPFRYICHNGEINTVRGNVNQMRAREGILATELFGVQDCFPICEPDQSDSAMFDNVLELLTLAGKPLPEAVALMMPQPWEKSPIPENQKNMFKYNAATMEPWDGPALVCFTDGDLAGGCLDRNGLRPCRYYITRDHRVIAGSEAGLLPHIKPEDVVKRGRLQPGKMFIIDFNEHRFIEDQEFKQGLAEKHPYGDWIEKSSLSLDDVRRFKCEGHGSPAVANGSSMGTKVNRYKLQTSLTPGVMSGVFASGLRSAEFPCTKFVDSGARMQRLRAFGYHQEALEMLLLPMGIASEEALGSMGNDIPLAVLSKMPRLCYEYFYQLFAQVTNPPIDPIREAVVMSVSCWIGPEQNLLADASQEHCGRLWLENPIITPEDMDAIYAMSGLKKWKVKVIDSTFPRQEGSEGLRHHLDRICEEAIEAVENDHCQVIILTDRATSKDRVQIPALLASGAVHQTLVREKLRSLCALIIDSGEPHEVAHQCLLFTFGVDAVCPYGAYDALVKLRDDGKFPETQSWSDTKLYQNYQKAVAYGMLKVMAKIGISTLASYKGAQIAEPIGLHKDVVNLCFTGVVSQLGGLTFEQLAERTLEVHERGYPGANSNPTDYIYKSLDNEGKYHYRAAPTAEKHLNDPMVIAKLQEAARTNSRHAYASFAALHNNLIKQTALRGQFEFKEAYEIDRSPIDLELVEPASEIVKRFRTGAMSYGSISMEAHSTLAIALNRLEGNSNSGEGGEDPRRFKPMENGDSTCSAIKQIASGRFGVDVGYLCSAKEIQIKMAQGAKPGEGGELPGHKVIGQIAQTRNSTPGVGLISPPPHHDIYSIEDLAQLIYDAKNTNPGASISVKLVSEVGVGVVAAGVAKCKADHILISGADGGTGAAKWTGVKHCGAPWEVGLAETHQTLVLNGLRGRVALETDGNLRTGRDVIIAALLGAESFGFATAPLIAMGCIMMRKCHLNTCPVGIATQDPVLRQKFAGMPEHVANYLLLVAEEVRTLMAKLGFRTMDELIGHAEALRADPAVQDHSNLNYLPILTPAHQLPDAGKIGKVESHRLSPKELKDRDLSHLAIDLNDVLDRKLVGEAANCFHYGGRVSITYDKLMNCHRSTGALMSGELYRRWGTALQPGTCHVKFTGTSGQSFGAFGVKGMFLELEGDSQDYFGKGLSGGALALYPSQKSLSAHFVAEDNIIAGNACLIGSTNGVALIRGIAGERFCVRNSGVWAVVEGIGEHGCEYMTGGRVLVLGKTGGNFGAGMSGGCAWILDSDDEFKQLVNPQMLELTRMDGASHEAYPREMQDLENLLRLHVKFTGSVVAKGLLAEWPKSVSKFTRAFPKDYIAVLKKGIQEGKPMKMSSLEDWAPVMEGKEQKPILAKQVKLKTAKDLLPVDDIESMSKFAQGMRPQKVPVKSFQGKAKRGFIEYDRAEIPKRSALERAGDFQEIYATKDMEQIQTQAARCMDCGTPFCHQSVTKDSGCPLGNLIPEWNELVKEGRWREAFSRLQETNNFPEFTGTVCPAPCEGACVLGIIDDPVSIKSIELSIIDKAWEMGWMKPIPPAFRTNRKVAVIGSGPAGLACADQLNKMGHLVTLYERADRVGGLMMYGIPNMKSDKVHVIERRVQILRDEGIQFVTGAAGNIGGGGVAPTADNLMQEHHAVVLATGATVGQDMARTPGREFKGVHLAMEYLTKHTKALLDGGETGQSWRQFYDAKNAIDAKGKRVVVIGGGDTATDCIGTAVRQGATQVVNLIRKPQLSDKRGTEDCWPHWPNTFKVDYGHAEAAVAINSGKDIREHQVVTKEFVGNEKGVLTGIKVVSVTYDEKMKATEIEGSERVIEADLIFLALGFSGPERSLADMFKFDVTERRNYKASYNHSPGDFCTSNSQVFATGDCRRGQSLVVWAIKEGRDCAVSVHKFLNRLPELEFSPPPRRQGSKEL